jgi:hypothetical protein
MRFRQASRQPVRLMRDMATQLDGGMLAAGGLAAPGSVLEVQRRFAPRAVP